MGNQRSTSFDSGFDNFRRNSRNYSNHDTRHMSPVNAMKRKRYSSSDSLDRDDYGWFEDFESPSMQRILSTDFPQQPLQRALTLPTPATEVPMYVLESSLETQQLWYKTAGRRPRQPSHEREYFENLWKQNFQESEIPHLSKEEFVKEENKNLPMAGDGSNVEVLYRGKASFTYSVNKAFPESHVNTMTIQLPYYRICRAKSGRIHAEFLVVVVLGGQGAVTFGIWKRYSDFNGLAKRVTELNLRTGEEMFKNTLLSWQCVLQRKRWIKSLDKEYLSVKCFLIGRFMHDLLFESPNPNIISSFLGLQNL